MHVTVDLWIDPGLRVPGKVARMLSEQVMGVVPGGPASSAGPAADGA